MRRISGASWGRATSDRGDVASGLLVMVLLLVFIDLIVFGGRLAAIRAHTNAAAAEAARVGSVAAGSTTVETNLVDVVEASLTQKGAQCKDPSIVSTDQTAFEPGGVVAIEVTCKVATSDLGLLGIIGIVLPETLTMKGYGYEAIDPLRYFTDTSSGEALEP